MGVMKVVLPADALPEIIQRLVADVHGPRALESFPVPVSALAN
jgi:hypothetical protein